MNRRNLLISASSGLGLLALSAKARGADSLCSDINMSTEISANHGHDLVLTPAATIQALRETAAPRSIALSIQGSSGHDHQVQLSHLDLLNLLVQGELILQASTTFGHTHQIMIRMSV